MHLRIGSRGSRLALWQSNHIASHLQAVGHSTEIILVKTIGDSMQDPSFAANNPITPELDGKGIFIKEIEEALLAGTIDLAVHSLKDLPTQVDPRFAIAAVPERADPRDCLLCPDWMQLHTLPSGARIGTTSPRRMAQLRAHRPDLQFVAIRGNIDTRIRKLARGDCDALVLACAGLDRLGPKVLRTVELDPSHPEFNRAPHVECVTHPGDEHLHDHASGEELPGQSDWIRERFDPEVLCPAPGQGALAIEVLASARDIIAVMAPLENASARYAVTAERAVLHALGGGCALPVGALCTFDRPGVARLQTAVTAPDGEQEIASTFASQPRESAADFGTRVAASLRAAGALTLLAGEERDPAFVDEPTLA